MSRYLSRRGIAGSQPRGRRSNPTQLSHIAVQWGVDICNTSHGNHLSLVIIYTAMLTSLPLLAAPRTGRRCREPGGRSGSPRLARRARV